MQIICKRAYVFCDTEIHDNPTTNEKMAVVKRKFAVSPNVNPQSVPDWIRNDGLFELAVQDGAITEVVVVSKMINSEEKAKPVDDSGIAKTPSTATTLVGDQGGTDIVGSQKQQNPTEQMGWGAKVPSTGLNK